MLAELRSPTLTSEHAELRRGAFWNPEHAQDGAHLTRTDRVLDDLHVVRGVEPRVRALESES